LVVSKLALSLLAVQLFLLVIKFKLFLTSECCKHIVVLIHFGFKPVILTVCWKSQVWTSIAPNLLIKSWAITIVYGHRIPISNKILHNSLK